MNLFKMARKYMYKKLLSDKSLYIAYQSNIAMKIYDMRRKDGRLNHKECNDVAHELIKLIFG